MPVNRLFRFDPERGKLEILSNGLPEVWAHRTLGRADAWAVAPDGAIYGGNASDGQLFRLDPATGQVVNLGKPALTPRIFGLAITRDGTLYGVTGGTPGYSRLFSWDVTRGFKDLGSPMSTMTGPGIEQGIPWRGFRIGTLAASEDGRYLVLGEQEALSQLMVFKAVP